MSTQYYFALTVCAWVIYQGYKSIKYFADRRKSADYIVNMG